MNIADRILRLQYNLARETNIIQDQVIVLGKREYTELIELLRNEGPNYLPYYRGDYRPNEFHGTKIIYVPIDSFLEVGTDKCFSLWISDYRSKEKSNG